MEKTGNKNPNMTEWYVDHNDFSRVLAETADGVSTTVVAECPGYQESRETRARVISVAPVMYRACALLVEIEKTMYDADRSTTLKKLGEAIDLARSAMKNSEKPS